MLNVHESVSVSSFWSVQQPRVRASIGIVPGVLRTSFLLIFLALSHAISQANFDQPNSPRTISASRLTTGLPTKAYDHADHWLQNDDRYNLLDQSLHGLIPSATVSLDGGAEYTSIQAAVDNAPAQLKTRYIIHIAAGTYEEIVRVPSNKPMIMFLGDGMQKTIITGSRSVGMEPETTTYESATVAVKGRRFLARGISIVNTAGPEGNQAVALRTESDMAAFYQCAFIGHQDTLNAQLNRQFFKRCLIMGTIDFVFGFAAAVFQDCEIRVRMGGSQFTNSYITAHGRENASDLTGFVFHHCVVNGTNEFMRNFEQQSSKYITYLGRPWGSHAVTVFLMTRLESLIHPQGWVAWKDDDPPPNTVIFGEYGNVGPGADPSQRVPWLSHINSTTVQLYDLQNFIQGDSWLPSTGFPYSSISASS